MGKAVRPAVHPAVDRMGTPDTPVIVHSYAARRPPPSPQLALTPRNLISNVTVAGYEAVHSVHSLYFFLLLNKDLLLL